ncbi:UDP-N-acetylmuramate--L-alanine ligase [Dietzia sp.]|uniref:UDP-N-acetylmuramate--L-alanine ligase n=1 Tax=Dietzia sp. TaxID=1871616 RepID=UPI002FD9F5E1
MSTTPTSTDATTSSEEPFRSVHLIGIGGAGMSAIARILLGRGVAVSGSDQRDGATIAELTELGAHIAIGHEEGNLRLTGAMPEAVVISKAAIPADNPELVAARAAAGIPVLTRSQVLGRLAATGRSIMVCGTHGKTSTTSMLVSGLLAADLDPSFAVGGTVLELGTNARGGADPVFVAEADESDGSLVDYQPDVVILTNAEPDHMDHFSSEEEYFGVFDTFIARIGPDGALVACLDDPGAAERARRAAAAGVRVLGYTGEPEALPADLRPLVAASISGIEVVGDTTRGTLALDRAAGQPSQHRISVGIAGEHMLFNAVAALLSAHEVGAEQGAFAAGLAAFGGVGRRFEFKGSVAGVRVYDDYAHHPTEVRAVLTAARAAIDSESAPAAGEGALAPARLIALFQPHMYSRTKLFAAEFGEALSLADEVVVAEVYGAREQPQPGVDAALVAGHVSVPVVTAEDLDAVTAAALDLARPGDTVFTIGAGDITTVGPRLLEALAARSS